MSTTRLAVLLALSACTADLLPVEQAPPANAFPLAVSTEVFQSSWVWSGRQVDLAVNGISGPETVFFGFTTTTTRPGPCPPALLGECLDIGGPGLTLLGAVQADANGIAFLRTTLPTLPTGDIAFQAAYGDGSQGFTSNRIDLPILSDRGDIDGDGAPDFIELNFGTDPTNPDTDGDGLTETDEVLIYGTNPRDADTDRGGVSDGAEVAAGTDPLDGTDDTTLAIDINSVLVGELVITEVLQNPDVVPDSGGEWFEIYNKGSRLIDLEGMVVSDAGSDSFTVVGQLLIEAGDYLVFSKSADENINGLVFPDYEYGPAMNFSNSDDELILSNVLGVLDEIAWDGGPLWPDPTGATMSLDVNTNDHVNNDDGANWCEGNVPFGDGDLGTPGAANPACIPPVDTDGDGLLDTDELTLYGTDPAEADSDGDGLTDGDEVLVQGTDPTSADTDGDTLLDGDELTVTLTDPTSADTDGGGIDDGTEVNVDNTDPNDPTDDVTGQLTAAALTPGDLVITEVLQNPAANSDSDAEWFEVYNASGSPIDLDGLVVSDADGQSFTVTGSVVIADGSYALFGANPNTFVNGDLTFDVVYSGFSFSNSDDEIILANATGVIDQVFYDGGPTFPDPDGASMALDPSARDATANDDGSNWCEGTTPFGQGDLGTPGAPNPSCGGATAIDAVSPGALVITEIMQNPTASTDPNGEYVEIYNASSSAIDLNGLVLSDLGANSFTLTTSHVVAPGAYAVLSPNADPIANGGVDVDVVYTGFNLTNSDDEVVLSNASGVIDEVAYDGGPLFPNPAGASMNLSSNALDATSNDDGANWCTSVAIFGIGDAGTPGTSNETCP